MSSMVIQQEPNNMPFSTSLLLVACVLALLATTTVSSLPNRFWTYRQVLCSLDRFVSLQRILSCDTTQAQLPSLPEPNPYQTFGTVAIYKKGNYNFYNKSSYHTPTETITPLPLFAQLAQSLPRSVQADRSMQTFILKHLHKQSQTSDMSKHRMVVISIENGPKKWTGKEPRARIYIPLDLDMSDFGGRAIGDSRGGEHNERDNKLAQHEDSSQQASATTMHQQYPTLESATGDHHLSEQSTSNNFMVLPDAFLGIEQPESYKIDRNPGPLMSDPQMIPLEESVLIELLKQTSSEKQINLIQPTPTFRRVTDEWNDSSHVMSSTVNVLIENDLHHKDSQQ